MFDNDQENDLFWQIIRELTFRPTITIPALYSAISEYRLGRETYDTCFFGKGSSDKYISEYKRNQRLFMILSKSDDEKSPISELAPKEKMYDKILLKKQLSLYNYMAEMMGWQCLGENPPSVEVLFETVQIDGGNPYDDIISKYYPYYYIGDRDGITFVEYILLLCVSAVTRSRTQTFFEKQINNPSDKKGIHKWIEKVSSTMHSEAVYMTCVDTFFSQFYYVVSRQFNDNLDCWQTLIDKEDEKLRYYYQYQKLFELMEGEPRLREMQSKLMPVIWCILNVDNAHNYKAASDKRWLEYQDVSTIEKANKYVPLIKDYIDHAILEAESILPSFFGLQ